MPFGILYNQFKDIFDKVFGKMPKKAVKFLRTRGDFVITDIKIRRDPIMSIINKLLNIISLGKFDKEKKRLGFDDLFHLSLVITLSDSSQYVIEKNQTINIGGTVPKETDKTELYPVSLDGRRITVNQLIENTIKNVGEDRFLNYDAFSTNCQRFILDILESNNLSDQYAKAFIYQDVSEMIESLPEYINKVAKLTTDTAGMIDRAMQWLGLKRGGRVINRRYRKQKRFGKLN